MANVFISHRGADAAEAEKLASEVRRRGHEVWLDIWKIHIGDSIVARINEGLSDSSYFVLCYSGAGTLAPWMSREWMSALARQLNGEGIRVLPVLLTGGGPPAILADIRFADLTTDWQGGINALCSSIV
jgi:TIR domain